MNKELKLHEAEALFFDDDYESFGEICGSSEDEQISVKSVYVYIPEIKMFVRDGRFIDDNASVTVFYESDNTDQYLTFETDPMVLAVYNFLNGEKAYEEVGNLHCFISDAA